MSQEYTQYIVEHKANVEKAYRWLVDHNIFEDCEFPVNIILFFYFHIILYLLH